MYKVKLISKLCNGEEYIADFSGVEHETREAALKEMHKAQDDPLFAGEYFAVRQYERGDNDV